MSTVSSNSSSSLASPIYSPDVGGVNIIHLVVPIVLISLLLVVVIIATMVCLLVKNYNRGLCVGKHFSYIYVTTLIIVERNKISFETRENEDSPLSKLAVQQHEVHDDR